MHTKIYTPKVSAKGLMTLPKEVRVALGIKEKEGDRVLLKVQPDGKVTLERAVIIPAEGGVIGGRS